MEQKIFKILSDLMTFRVTRKDLKDLHFYAHSQKRLCVREPNCGTPEAWFKDKGPNLKDTGFATTKELAEWLRENGVREVRKPKPYRPTAFPLYD